MATIARFNVDNKYIDKIVCMCVRIRHCPFSMPISNWNACDYSIKPNGRENIAKSQARRIRNGKMAYDLCVYAFKMRFWHDRLVCITRTISMTRICMVDTVEYMGGKNARHHYTI